MYGSDSVSGQMNKNILIVGGSYFVGRVFVELLLEKEDIGIYVVNRGTRPFNHDRVTEIVCDRHDVNLKAILPNVTWDVLIDFCAYSPLDIIQMMMAVEPPAIGQYILISTTSVYENSLDLPLKEDSPKLSGPQPELGIAANYGFDKWQAESKLMDLCRKTKLPYTIFRPTIIYGKYNYAPRESYFFDLILKKSALAIPENKLALFTFVSVWDVARAISLCISNKKAFDRSFNLAGEELVSYERYVEVLRGITGNRISTYSMAVQDILDQHIALPFPLEEHLICSGELAQKTLGVTYMPFVEGMKKTWQWYCDEH